LLIVLKKLMSKIIPFTEKEIRTKIKSKIGPEIKRGTKHDKGLIYLDEIVVAKVKIPNGHSTPLSRDNQRHLIQSLKLEAEEFNSLIKCPLSKKEYYQLLKERV